MMKEWKVSIVYRLFFILICFSGVWLGLTDDEEDAFMGQGTAINFYTLQSNIWVLTLETYLLLHAMWHRTKKTSKSPWNIGVFKYIFTVSIMLTFFVYWFMLAPYIAPKDILKPSNLLLHAFSPILMLLDFLFFDREYVVPQNAMLLSLIPAIYYLMFILIRAEVSPVALTLGSRYPYWFMDVDAFRMDWQSKWHRRDLLDIWYRTIGFGNC